MGGIGGMEWGRMKVVLRTGVGRGEASEESEERRKGKLEVLQIWDDWSKTGPGKSF